MIKMTKTVEFEGLEQARKEFNNWNGKAEILIDCDDLTSWCDINIKDYDSDSIISLVFKDDLNSPNHKYSINTLKNIANEKYKDFKNSVDTLIINDDYNYAHHIKGGNTYM